MVLSTAATFSPFFRMFAFVVFIMASFTVSMTATVRTMSSSMTVPVSTM